MVVAVEAEADQVPVALPPFPVGDAARPGGDVQPRLRLQVVVAELDLGAVKGQVGAALQVGDALVQVVDRFSVHRDAHEVQGEGVDGVHLAGHAQDVHPFVVVHRDLLVVDHLHLDAGGAGAGEAGGDHVVGLHVAAPLELRPCRGEPHLLANQEHAAAGACRGPADVVAVDGGVTPVEPLVLYVAGETKPHVGPLADLRHQFGQPLGVTRREDGVAVRKEDRGDRAGGGIVDTRHRLASRVLGAELRLVGKLLQGVVVQELDLDAAVQTPPLRGVVGGDRLHAPLAVALEERLFSLQGVLDREGDATRHRPREPDLVAVDALVARLERSVVAVGGEADRDVLLVLQVVEPLAHLP